MVKLVEKKKKKRKKIRFVGNPQREIEIFNNMMGVNTTSSTNINTSTEASSMGEASI